LGNWNYFLFFAEVEVLFRNLPSDDRVMRDCLGLLQHLDVGDPERFHIFPVLFDKIEVLFRNLPSDNRVMRVPLQKIQKNM